MDNYQHFWNSEISNEGHLQLVLDWDVFIRNFTASIANYAHYQLNSTQREFIRAKIDPHRKGEVCKAAFLLFAQDYWDVPSNRTNLFKMRMNLTHVLPRLTLLSRSTPQRLAFTITYLASSKKVSIKYEYREDILYEIDEKGYEKDERKLTQKGFITIGSASTSDISIQDSLFINKSHLKIASTKKIVKSPKKRSIFEQKADENIEVVEWFVRDTARSNRMKYVLDTQHKFVFIKPGMVISFGLTGDLELQIIKIDNSAADFGVSPLQQNQIESLLNADRINFMGEVDANVPLKTTLEMDFKELTSKQIQEMVKDKLYYPIRETLPVKSGDKKQAPSLSCVIFNRRNFEKTQISAIQPYFTVGRSKTCKYRVNDIGVREQELIFRCLNGFWTVSSANPIGNCSFDINPPAVFLTPLRSLQEGKVSNRVQIREGYPYRLRGKQFEVEIELTEAKGSIQDE